MSDKKSNKATTSFDEVDKSDGAFKRKPTTYHHKIEKGGEFPPEANRYHLYVSLACPWACRCVAFINLKGLQDVIPVHTVFPVWGKLAPDQDDSRGWVFKQKDDKDHEFGGVSCVEPLYGLRTLRQLYEKDDPDYTGKYTTPTLWDAKTEKIVNTESSEIIRFLNNQFNEFAKNPSLDLCPADRLKEIESINEEFYNSVNNGVYRSGFATTQEAYDEAVNDVFNELDRLEERLGKSRYLLGNTITESDIRLFVTLVRFDKVYVGHFKCNKKTLHEYPNLWAYTRDLYQMPAIRDSVNFDHIRHHYHRSHPSVNPHAIVPAGPTNIDFDEPHNRDKM